MSNTQVAFIEKSRVPDRATLQASIDALGFDLALDPAFTPFEDEGFSPCVLAGEGDVGFEVFYGDADELTDGDETLEAIAAGRDYAISMVWRSSMKDLVCVMIVSCALAKDFGAVISYEAEEPETLPALLESTRRIVTALGGK